ncbi:MAG: hypothetical protein LBT66_05415 [Methanobrevibacter sp.]|jgi:hypothetical protein|nr:hypothetical protein [Candidatus Methanovirga meridionalis]
MSRRRRGYRRYRRYNRGGGTSLFVLIILLFMWLFIKALPEICGWIVQVFRRIKK